MASQTVQLQGSISGLGSLAGKDVVAAAELAPGAVSYAHLQDVASGQLLGRASAGAGRVEEIKIGAGLRLSGQTLTVSGSGDYTYAVDRAASATVTVDDQRKLISATTAGITLTLDPAGFAAGQWVDIANLAAGSINLVAGAGGAINRAGQASVSILPQQLVRVAYRGAVIPAWVADVGEFSTVAEAGAADGWILGRAGAKPAWRSPAQARADLGVADRVTWLPLSIPDPLNRTYALPFVPYAASINGLDYRCAGGLRSARVTVQIADQDDTNPTAITGMSALAATTARQSAVGTGNNRLAGTGATDRTLLVTVANVVGSNPSRLDLSLKLTRTS